MSARPWYPRYPRDFRAKTMHLNLTERGAYDALIDHYYEIQQPLPCDPESLYRITGAFTKRDREAVDRVSREFFTNGDGRLRNIRCDEELAKMQARSEQQSELANRRWNNAKAHAKALPSQSQGNANHSHSQKERSNTLSGSARRDMSKQVLDYLNAATQSKFRETPSNLKLIEARMKEGASVDDCKTVIDAKVAQWQHDTEMSQYLRPETLFNATKFSQYCGQSAPAALGYDPKVLAQLRVKYGPSVRPAEDGKFYDPGRGQRFGPDGRELLVI